MNEFRADRIASITLDDKRIIKRTPEIEHERRVAIADLLESNQLALLEAKIVGPYDVFLSARDNRLLFRLTGTTGESHDVTLPLTPLRGVIKDYFLMCEGYYDAIRQATPDRIQTLDMARRAVHNEGSELLRHITEGALSMDLATARRLFTLVCVLHIK